MSKNYTLTACISLLSILCLGTNLQAQSKALKQLQLSVQLSDKDSCAVDTLRLYSWTGIQVEEIAKVTATKAKNGFEFNFNLKNVAFGNYYLGRLVNNSISDMRPVLLGLEDKIVLKGTCTAMQQISFEDSKVNSSFESMVDSIKVQGNEFLTLITEFQQNAGNKEKQAATKKAIFELDFSATSVIALNKPVIAAALSPTIMMESFAISNPLKTFASSPGFVKTTSASIFSKPRDK